jgi:hypothetical protein
MSDPPLNIIGKIAPDEPRNPMAISFLPPSAQLGRTRRRGVEPVNKGVILEQ